MSMNTDISTTIMEIQSTSSTNQMSTLDPYGLLGVSMDSSPGEVRRAYFDLCRLVHPDKGGNASDMVVVHCAYKYVLAQVSEVNRTVSIEDLEERFAAFCREQLDEPVPEFMPDMCCMEADANMDAIPTNNLTNFHRTFEARTVTDHRGRSSHTCGYADMMEQSKYHGQYGDNTPVTPVPFVPFLSSGENEGHDNLVKNGGYVPFESRVVTYSEPMTAVTDTRMTFCEVVMSEGLDDYGTSRPVEMTDYKAAFTTTRDWYATTDTESEVFTKTYEQVMTSRMIEVV